MMVSPAPALITQDTIGIEYSIPIPMPLTDFDRKLAAAIAPRPTSHAPRPMSPRPPAIAPRPRLTEIAGSTPPSRRDIHPLVARGMVLALDSCRDRAAGENFLAHNGIDKSQTMRGFPDRAIPVPAANGLIAYGHRLMWVAAGCKSGIAEDIANRNLNHARVDGYEISASGFRTAQRY